MSLPLHIFEQRYKELVGECLAGNAPFGVVRVKAEEGVAETGCTAEIQKVVKRYEDGRLDILVVGRRRFEIVTVHHDRSFLQAEVLFVHDEQEAPAPEERQRAVDLFLEIQDTVGGEEEINLEADTLSYELAGSLPLDLDFKQTLLGVRSEAERLRGLIEFFEAVLPRLKKAARRREKAGGNGHVP